MTTMHNPPHPGEALREDVLPALGMTEAEFAKHLGYPVERLAAVLNSCSPISACRRRTASWWNSLCMEVWGVERPGFCGWG